MNDEQCVIVEEPVKEKEESRLVIQIRNRKWIFGIPEWLVSVINVAAKIFRLAADMALIYVILKLLNIC